MVDNNNKTGGKAYQHEPSDQSNGETNRTWARRKFIATSTGVALIPFIGVTAAKTDKSLADQLSTLADERSGLEDIVSQPADSRDTALYRLQFGDGSHLMLVGRRTARHEFVFRLNGKSYNTEVTKTKIDQLKSQSDNLEEQIESVPIGGDI